MKKSVSRIVFGITAFAVLLPAYAGGWWDPDWSYRKSLTVDTTAAGADIGAEVTDVPVLVRLHTGNFSYFLDLVAGAADLRFVASDDKTVLKHHVEKFDPINEMALVWVKLPRTAANSKSDTVFMYYGNEKAPVAEDAPGTYDSHQALVYHFDGTNGAVQDKSSYGNHPSQNTAQPNPVSMIGAGVHFAGNGTIAIPASPSLRMDPQQGWTFSTWLKLDGAQADAYVLHLQAGNDALVLGIQDTAAYARLNAGGRVFDTGKQTALKPGTWHHLAAVVGDDHLRLYLDGVETASVKATTPTLLGAVTLGGAPQGGHFLAAEVDEVQISSAARPASWIKASTAQGSAAKLLTYGEDGQNGGEGGTSYFAVILSNVTLDGWIVIVLLAVMAVISWMVMFAKGVMLQRVRNDNESFLNAFRQHGIDDVDAMRQAHETTLANQQKNASIVTVQLSKVLALVGLRIHPEQAALYGIYETGMRELQQRVGSTVGSKARGISPQSLSAIRASLDAVQVREVQQLNGQMVLLTIAISGGPFLGLLGTVVGVMITFAAIAASGDVNVNAIAPGIAAALVATVAGLAVAIPAMFGYNYLGSQVKDVVANMHVFVDELVSKIAERYGE